MSSKLKVRFKRQSYDYDCLPTCVYMILDYIGSPIEYEELLRLCKTDRYGTTLTEVAEALEKLGFSVKTVNMDLSDLIKHVRGGAPVIAFVDPYYFPWVKVHCSHSVVVVGVYEEGLTILDPLKGEKNCPFSVFLSAWRPFNNLVMLIAA
ncbi:MAG: cysteine peptidase family C39 domain-containing protein [Candidatus Bathyarchaeales archaeon]